MLKFLRSIIRRPDPFDDAAKQKFLEAVSSLLQVQLILVGEQQLKLTTSNIRPEALGYVYGFVDAALRACGQDMTDVTVGVPLTFQVLRKLFPGREEQYLRFLIDHVSRDPLVLLGASKGGQQYVDFSTGKLSAPMGLARYLLEAA